jgi:hypothetical protein
VLVYSGVTNCYNLEEKMEKITMSIIKTGSPAVYAPIEMWVRENELGLQVGLDDYLQTLVANIGNPAFILTQAGLLKALREASATTVVAMKNETIKLAI